MTIPVCFATLLSLSTGLVFVLVCWPDRQSIKADFLLKFFLAPGVGCGVSSLLFFLSLLTHTYVRHLALIEVFLLACLIALLCFSVAATKWPVSTARSSEPPIEPSLDRKIRRASLLGFVAAFAVSLYASLSLLLRGPHGEWDAFAIWNLRARFLFRAGDQWKDAFSRLIPWSHTDYPLLVPGSVARLWEYSGHDSVAAPALLALIFTYATVGLAVSSVAALRTRSQGFLAGLVLVATPYFVQLGASEYADVPLGFFYLATLVLLCMQDRRLQSPSRFLLLAGITAGFAAWTKNEGLLFLASLLFVHAAVMVYLRGGTTYIRQLLPFAAGFVPILIVVVFFKHHFGGPSDLFSAPRSMAHQLLDVHRYFQVCRALLRQVFDFGGWVITPVAVLAFYFLTLGGDINPKDKAYVLISVLALFMTLVGYCVVYVAGPNDIQWWLSSSLNRLLIQLWPSAVFLFFLVVRTPEQAISVGGSRSSVQRAAHALGAEVR